ncbi:DUF3826 domain-containing protein [Parapedobacter tibetensis]|uniref:DUF3826 domain-containing protein n=1 Tax=Parapedobacter tibetensis TaxID=2972951 RepID=UPI00214D587A|nr:DUF3826 domain-containing protein [Parapedobacter tibetensis]
MNNLRSSFHGILFFLIILSGSLQAQDNQVTDEYTRVVNERAKKIVDSLAINDSAEARAVQQIIANQYIQLNQVHDHRDQEKAQLRERYSEDKKVLEKKIEELESHTEKRVSELHHSFLNKLAKQIDEQKIDRVKDGLTYYVMPITYRNYLEMLPTLTERQKLQLWEYLKEAREIAMDKGSSKEKHAVFGKYKGKINNYLSAEGMETEEARRVWEAKLRGRQKG